MHPTCPHCGKVVRRVPYDTPPDRLHQLYAAGWCPWVIGPESCRASSEGDTRGQGSRGGVAVTTGHAGKSE